MEGVRGSNPLSSTGRKGRRQPALPRVGAYHRGVFPGARAVGAVVDDVLAFLRPSVVHVREERQRLELMRDEEGDADHPLAGDRSLVLRVPAGWQAPHGPRRREPAYDSRGIQA
jgi:hypothetical protein